MEKVKHGRVTAIQDANIIVFDNIEQLDPHAFKDLIACCYKTVARLDLMCFVGDTAACAKPVTDSAHPFRDIVQSAELYNSEVSVVLLCVLQKLVRGTKDMQNIVMALCRRDTALLHSLLLQSLCKHIVVGPRSKQILHDIVDSLTTESSNESGIITPYIHGDWGVVSLNVEVQSRRNTQLQGASLTTGLGSAIYTNHRALCLKDVKVCGLRKGMSVVVVTINGNAVTVQ